MQQNISGTILNHTCVALVTAAIAWAPKGVAAAWLMAFDTPSATWSTPVMWKRSVGSTRGAWPNVVSQALQTTCRKPRCQEQAAHSCTAAIQQGGDRLIALMETSLDRLSTTGNLLQLDTL